jgi:riboflavin synthase
MFTGIVEELGRVAAVEERPAGRRFWIEAPLVAADAAVGDSIACCGCCLTVVKREGSRFAVEAVPETLACTTLGAWREGDGVNLERSLRLEQRLGGHLVQGHVDATGTIISRSPADHWDQVRISLPAAISRYVVHKGSIAVDGISLTVSALGPPGAGPDGATWFEVSLIPETLKRTTMGTRQPGEVVNLEVDVIAKYVERLLSREGSA